MAAKLKNNRTLLASAVSGWQNGREDGLFSSPCWLAFHAGRHLAASNGTRPAKCAKSRGYSVKIETEQGNQYLIAFKGKGLQHITARIL